MIFVFYINCTINKTDGNLRGINIPCQSQPGFLDNVVHRLGSQTILAHRTGDSDSVKNKNVSKKKPRETLLVRWLNQPIFKKNMRKSNWIISPYSDENLKNI